MPILLIAEHDGHVLSDQTARLVSAAARIGGDIDVLVAGTVVGPVAAAAATIAGIRRVLVSEGEGQDLAEPLAATIVALAPGYEVLLAATSTSGKNVMPRVAALLDVMQVSDVIEVLAPDTFKRPIYAGNATQTVQATDPVRVLTVRPTAFPAGATGASAPIETVAAAGNEGLSRLVGNQLAKSGRPELGSARVVVAGGRALGSEAKFAELLLPLADKLGAGIAASRAAVDAGYAPNDWQVGQTGKVVAPDLYIAIGISGAIQHLAGMKDSRVIVAINSDADAPIFQMADYGLVGDLFTIVPELEKAL